MKEQSRDELIEQYRKCTNYRIKKRLLAQLKMTSSLVFESDEQQSESRHHIEQQILDMCSDEYRTLAELAVLLKVYAMNTIQSNVRRLVYDGKLTSRSRLGYITTNAINSGLSFEELSVLHKYIKDKNRKPAAHSFHNNYRLKKIVMLLEEHYCTHN